MKESKAMMKKEVSFMKKKGAPKSMLKHEMAEMRDMKKGTKKMMGGGMGSSMGYAKGGMTKSGSSASKRADGIASKGKTKGKMVKMMGGGYCG